LNIKQIEDDLRSHFDAEYCNCELNGNHMSITLVSDQFESVRKTQRQQRVYSAGIGELITTNQLHAVNIQSFTSQEWQTFQKQQVL